MASIGQKFIKNAKNAQFGEFLNFSRTKKLLENATIEKLK